MLMILPAPLALWYCPGRYHRSAGDICQVGGEGSGSFLKFQRSRGGATGGGGRGSREREDRGERGYDNRRKKEKERRKREEGRRSERQRRERKEEKEGKESGRGTGNSPPSGKAALGSGPLQGLPVTQGQ